MGTNNDIAVFIEQSLLLSPTISHSPCGKSNEDQPNEPLESSPTDVTPEAANAIRLFNKLNVAVLLIDLEQSEISEPWKHAALDDLINQRLEEYADAYVNGCIVCELETDENQAQRIPRLLFLEQAQQQFGFTPTRSYFIACNESLRKTAQEFGLCAIHYQANSSPLPTNETRKNYSTNSLIDAASFIQQQISHAI